MRVTINKVREMKQKGEKITMLTAYDYAVAKIVDEAGIPLILVGDSLGMVVLGYESTIPVTMEEMLHHTKAVARGTRQAMVIGDMPFMTYHISTADALKNAARFIQEAGAQAVKLEGGTTLNETISFLTARGIPVMAHIGLTPQAVQTMGGYRTQGRKKDEWARLEADAHAVEEAGAFAVVLEGMAEPLAERITGLLKIPTIGIGASAACDGQILVIDDMLGMSERTPGFVKQYGHLAVDISGAIEAYANDVRTRAFPGPEHTYAMKKEK